MKVLINLLYKVSGYVGEYSDELSYQVDRLRWKLEEKVYTDLK